MIRYLSVCSGIEAFSCAVRDMPEFVPVAFSEIEPFPCRVLTHHYPDVPNLGDMTQINGEAYRGAVDLVVGGTPCQDFSVAGTRKGLAGERSGLAMHFVRIVRECMPRWVLWENVPGCTTTPSSDPGRDFSTFVSAIHELGYCIAYRILDAVNFGVPQYRRRVFLVGYFGAGWRCAAEVLFERDSLCGNTSQGRKTKKETSSRVEGGTGKTRTYQLLDFGHYRESSVVGARKARDYKDATDLILNSKGLRKLTPLETERLMGFPDNYTNMPGVTDTARYKALGNSMAVPCMRWIAQRMAKVDKQMEQLQ